MKIDMKSGYIGNAVQWKPVGWVEVQNPTNSMGYIINVGFNCRSTQPTGCCKITHGISQPTNFQNE